MATMVTRTYLEHYIYIACLTVLQKRRCTGCVLKECTCCDQILQDKRRVTVPHVQSIEEVRKVKAVIPSQACTALSNKSSVMTVNCLHLIGTHWNIRRLMLVPAAHSHHG